MQSAAFRRAVFAALMALGCAAAPQDEVRIQYGRPPYRDRCETYPAVYLRNDSSRAIDASIRITALSGVGDVNYVYDLSVPARQWAFIGCLGYGPFILNYRIVRAEYK
jgi:hypothetical protein